MVRLVVRFAPLRYRVSRWSDAGGLFKRVVIDGGGAPLEVVERVAGFGLRDFRRMFALSGLRLASVHGDYTLAPFDVERSARLLMIARKDGDYRRDRLLRIRDTVSGETPRYEASMNCGTRCASDGYVSMNSTYRSSALALSAETIR